MAAFGREAHEAERLHVAAQAQFAQQKYREAAATWQAALAVAARIGAVPLKRRVQATLVGALACALDLAGDPDQAVGWHTKAFKLHGAIGDVEGQCSAVSNMGHSYLRLGDLERAGTCYEQAAEIADAEGLDALREQIVANRARLAAARSAAPDALESLVKEVSPGKAKAAPGAPAPRSAPPVGGDAAAAADKPWAVTAGRTGAPAAGDRPSWSRTVPSC